MNEKINTKFVKPFPTHEKSSRKARNIVCRCVARRSRRLHIFLSELLFLFLKLCYSSCDVSFDVGMFMKRMSATKLNMTIKWCNFLLHKEHLRTCSYERKIRTNTSPLLEWTLAEFSFPNGFSISFDNLVSWMKYTWPSHARQIHNQTAFLDLQLFLFLVFIFSQLSNGEVQDIQEFKVVAKKLAVDFSQQILKLTLLWMFKQSNKVLQTLCYSSWVCLWIIKD